MKEELKEGLMLKYKYAKDMLETEINILINDYVTKEGYNPVEHIKSRLKSEKSILDKLERKGLNNTVEDIKNHIHDIIGLRIVVSFLNDVYDVVNIIKSSKNIIVKDEKDYIETPKSTGYISYHLIVKVPIYLIDKVEYVDAEIQIRTMAMDFWASIDHKIQYKFPNEIPEDVKEKMYENSLIINELDNRMMKLNETINKYSNFLWNFK